MKTWADMAAAAQAAGLSYGRFNKTWRALVRTRGFPAPFSMRPYRWDPARLEAWRAASADGIARRLHQDHAANDDDWRHHDGAPPPIRRGRVAAGRARIMQRLAGLQ